MRCTGATNKPKGQHQVSMDLMLAANVPFVLQPYCSHPLTTLAGPVASFSLGCRCGLYLPLQKLLKPAGPPQQHQTQAAGQQHTFREGSGSRAAPGRACRGPSSKAARHTAL